MPIIVEFVKHALCPIEVKQQCGPYRLAELSGDRLTVFENFHPLILATRTPAGTWVVSGLEELVFEDVRFLPPSDVVEREFAAAEAEVGPGCEMPFAE